MIARRMFLGVALLGFGCAAPTASCAAGEFAGKQSGEWITMLREHKDAKHRRVALLALETIGPKVTGIAPALLEALREDPDAEVRREIAIMLGRIGPEIKGSTDALGERLANDKEPLVRQAAATALGGKLAKVADGQVRVLANALKDKHAGTRRAAAEALKNLGESAQPAVPQLIAVARDAEADRFTRIYAIQVIGQWGKDEKTSGPTLAAVLAEKGAHVTVRQAAAEGLGRLADDYAGGVAALGEALTGPVELRRTAAIALGQLGEKSGPAWNAMKTVLEDKKGDSAARYALVRAAARIAKDQPEAVPVLARLAKEDDAAENRLAAIRELGELGTTASKAVPALEQIARDDARASLRDAAEMALKKIKTGS